MLLSVARLSWRMKIPPIRTQEACAKARWA